MRPEILYELFKPLTALKGVGPKLVRPLAKAIDGEAIIDLLFHRPFGLHDRRARPTVAAAPLGQIATIEVTVDAHHPGRSRRAPYRVMVSDATGDLALVYFTADPEWLKKLYPVGARRLISGRVESYDGVRQMPHPDYAVALDQADQIPAVEPIYGLSAGLSARVMGRAIRTALALAPALPEWLDPALKQREAWPDWHTALAQLHMPRQVSDLAADAPALRRLGYDELLSNQLALALVRRRLRRPRGRSLAGDGRLQARVEAALPYRLTTAQTQAIAEIAGDLATPTAMLRLLQGDVGAGKTVVALFAMLIAVEAGRQACLMAPTEILARQHAQTLEPLCAAAGIRLAVLTARDSGRERRRLLTELAAGEIAIAVGTHALLEGEVVFRDLGLVVIDEQHRFGVDQRLALAAKGDSGLDVLVMSATPIPRTLTLTAFGDMDVSRLVEKPPGRVPVDTRVVTLARLDDMVAAVARALDDGAQVYWVCPLVTEAEGLDLVAADERHAHLKARFGDAVGLIHGRLKAREKDQVMTRFAAGALKILVATTVIEVGVDVRNATVMVVEHAERFGLAQLHQLRGRVGRGTRPSFCILLYAPAAGETARKRLEVLRTCDDGFVIAEADLAIRGAGEVLGTRQSGIPSFRLADLSSQGELMAMARDDARLILERDPQLGSPRGHALRILLYLFERDAAVRYLQSG